MSTAAGSNIRARASPDRLAGLNPSNGSRLLTCARPKFGRDERTAKTGYKWVVSAAGRKYLAGVARGISKMEIGPTSPARTN